MIEDHPGATDAESAPVLKHSVVSAMTWERFTVATEDGKPAMIAIIDEDGRVLDSGPQVAQELHDLAVLAYRRYLFGEGYLRVSSTPRGLFEE